MQKLACTAFAAVALLFASGAASAQTTALVPVVSSQIPNLNDIKDEIKAYYVSGNYLAEVRAIEADAQSYLDKRVHDGVAKPALVLDIDDTALSTYDYETAHDFGFDPASWNQYATDDHFTAITPTLDLVLHAKAENVAVFFVTGRRQPQTDVTRENLQKAGYPAPDDLFLRPVDDNASSVVPFKSGARATIESRGYTVLESIGDQWSDLNGGHAERVYKLPNPMYFIP
jgi:acid phosphatase